MSSAGPQTARPSAQRFRSFACPRPAHRSCLSWAGLTEAEAPAGTLLELELEDRRALFPLNVRVPNVCALLPGSDPELANEVIVLSAHFDHVGTNAEGEIFNGADDNGSGTAGLLQIAGALAARGPLPRSVLCMWVSAEELGLWGSAAWCADPLLPEGHRVVANLNMDMIGRGDPKYLELTPSRSHPNFNALADAAYRTAQQEGFAAPVPKDDDWGRSDHASFAEAFGVPVLYLSGGEHEDYHQPTDDVERIDVDKLCRIVRVALKVIEATADQADLTSVPALELRALERGDALAFGLELEESLQRFDAAPLNSAWLASEMHSRARRATQASGPAVEFALNEAEYLADFPGYFEGMLEGEYRYDFIDVREVDGELTLLFRESLVDSFEFDYMWLWVAQDDTGAPRVIDCAFLQDCLSWSDWIASLVECHIAGDPPSDADSLTLFDSQAEVADLMYDDAEAALDVWRDLPEHHRMHLDVLRSAAEAAAWNEDGDALLEILDVLYERPALRGTWAYQVVMESIWVGADDEFDEAYAHIEERTGDEAVLHMLEGDRAWAHDDIEAALGAYRAAAEADGDLECAYWEQLGAAGILERWKLFPDLLLILERDFGWDFSEIDQDERFAGFLGTPEYRAWQRDR